MHDATMLILPGLGNSGPDHWQTHWQARDARAVRVMQDEWRAPDCRDWIARLHDHVSRDDGPFVLVAHSSACVMAVHWALGTGRAHTDRIAGALLVAPSDPEAPRYPARATRFGPVPLERLPFPSHVVYSTDDPAVRPRRAREFGQAWGSRLTELEAAGHIEPRSGFGPWEEGYRFVEELRGASRDVFDGAV